MSGTLLDQKGHQYLEPMDTFCHIMGSLTTSHPDRSLKYFHYRFRHPHQPADGAALIAPTIPLPSATPSEPVQGVFQSGWCAVGVREAQGMWTLGDRTGNGLKGKL